MIPTWLAALLVLSTSTMPAGSDSATSRLRFGSVEGSVRVLDNHKRDSWQLPALVIDSLSIDPGQRLADIGAGTGYFNVYFAKAVGSGGRVFAEEIEPELVAYMQERADREATPQVVPILGTRDDPCLPDSLCCPESAGCSWVVRDLVGRPEFSPSIVREHRNQLLLERVETAKTLALTPAESAGRRQECGFPNGSEARECMVCLAIKYHRLLKSIWNSQQGAA